MDLKKLELNSILSPSSFALSLPPLSLSLSLCLPFTLSFSLQLGKKITRLICGNVQHNPTFDCCSKVLVGVSLLSTESNTSKPGGSGIDVSRVNAVQENQKDLPDKTNGSGDMFIGIATSEAEVDLSIQCRDITLNFITTLFKLWRRRSSSPGVHLFFMYCNICFISNQVEVRTWKWSGNMWLTQRTEIDVLRATFTNVITHKGRIIKTRIIHSKSAISYDREKWGEHLPKGCLFRFFVVVCLYKFIGITNFWLYLICWLLNLGLD